MASRSLVGISLMKSSVGARGAEPSDVGGHLDKYMIQKAREALTVGVE